MRFRGDLMTSEFDTVLLNGKITSRAGIAPLSCRILTVHAGNRGKVAEGETGREPPQSRPDGASAHSFPCLLRSSLCRYGEIWGVASYCDQNGTPKPVENFWLRKLFGVITKSLVLQAGPSKLQPMTKCCPLNSWGHGHPVHFHTAFAASALQRQQSRPYNLQSPKRLPPALYTKTWLASDLDRHRDTEES